MGSTFLTPPLDNPPITLASLNFAAIAPGSSATNFQGFTNLDATPLENFDLTLNAIVTPLPAALPLLAAALAGLGLVRYRKRSAKV